MIHNLLLSLMILLAVPGDGSDGAPTWRRAAADHVWSFPRDLYAHPDYKTEWWYITGNLVSDGPGAGEPLAFQLTFFRIGLQPANADTTASAWRPTDLVMAHAAVTDPTGSGHTFSEVVWRATPFLGGFGAPGDSTLAWCRAPAGTDDRWSLDYRGGAYRLRVHDERRNLRFDLTCSPRQQPVFHGQNGFSPKSNTGDVGSLYFSQTRMDVVGTVHRGGRPVAVRGESWLDREIFTSTLGEGQKGWDWLALQLDDGRELMLYRLLDQAGREDFALGTLIETDGTTTSLSGQQWNLRPTDFWQSPHTKASYPVAWTLHVPGAEIDLELRALIPDQENVSVRTGIHYWEGAVTARMRNSGVVQGRGFIEMTGYGKGSRPPV